MKSPVLFVLSVQMLMACNNDLNYPLYVRNSEQLNGNVKSTVVKEYDYDGEERWGEPVLGDLIAETTTEYNKNGSILSLERVEEGKVVRREKDEYKSGRLIAFSGEICETDDVYSSRFEYGKGYFKEYSNIEGGYIVCQEDENDRYHLYTRNEDGILLFEEFYNEHCYETKRIGYDDEGRVNYTQEWMYVDNMLKKYELVYVQSDWGNQRETYEYLKMDKLGNWVKRIKSTKEPYLSWELQSIEVREIEYR